MWHNILPQTELFGEFLEAFFSSIYFIDAPSIPGEGKYASLAILLNHLVMYGVFYRGS